MISKNYKAIKEEIRSKKGKKSKEDKEAEKAMKAKKAKEELESYLDDLELYSKPESWQAVNEAETGKVHIYKSVRNYEEKMTKKVYVGNLPFSVEQAKLKELFGSFGEIEEAVVISDRYSGRSKGFGFVTFVNDADADKAIAEMNEKDIEGRPLKVNEAKPREE